MQRVDVEARVRHKLRQHAAQCSRGGKSIPVRHLEAVFCRLDVSAEHFRQVLAVCLDPDAGEESVLCDRFLEWLFEDHATKWSAERIEQSFMSEQGGPAATVDYFADSATTTFARTFSGSEPPESKDRELDSAAVCIRETEERRMSLECVSRIFDEARCRQRRCSEP
eukprot:gnl/TRDRNA2_/TRDRNA2_198783_c0_seq1.p1 gnl/TRDRNA2_/TRDRNA2_198783_c0~~gnl/TRDRNA2_/TRDRNA2_198783_c0_seq1.p1  ORF type:complete len:167 (-),score=19.49 gnl/TRDRNA2_/TRDRNA2_198783_c0_seq1:279-779(-)